MGRNKKKPSYDPQHILSDVMNAAVEIYAETKSL